MIPLERASRDLATRTILIMKIQKGGPQIKIIWGENYSSDLSRSRWPVYGIALVCGVVVLDEKFSLLLYKINS